MPTGSRVLLPNPIRCGGILIHRAWDHTLLYILAPYIGDDLVLLILTTLSFGFYATFLEDRVDVIQCWVTFRDEELRELGRQLDEQEIIHFLIQAEDDRAEWLAELHSMSMWAEYSDSD